MTRIRVFCAKHPDIELEQKLSVGTESVFLHVTPCPECLREAFVSGAQWRDEEVADIEGAWKESATRYGTKEIKP